ncbi:hypothetical protein G3I76_47875, partial [Streptomyces sp. SID11233]|nr:hypothetical protein [Streptomyces sp. SID11233]
PEAESALRAEDETVPAPDADAAREDESSPRTDRAVHSPAHYGRGARDHAPQRPHPSAPDPRHHDVGPGSRRRG